MRIRKIIKYILIIVGALLTLQVVTYHTVAPYLLESKLLTGRLAALPHVSDSALVRNFYVTDCMTGDLSTYLSHNLRNDEESMKKKLNVKYIHFQTKEEFSWDNTGEEKYHVVYYTYVRRPALPVYVYFFFGAQQHESIRLNKDYFYAKDTTYHWILFFWIKSGLIPESIEDRLDSLLIYRRCCFYVVSGVSRLTEN